MKKRMLNLDIPSCTVRREVAHNIVSENKGRTVGFSLVCEIEEPPRPINNFPVRPVGCDDLFWVPAKGIHVQRHSIVEETKPASKDSLLTAKGSPGEPSARRNTHRFSNPLPFNSEAHVHGHPRADKPMVLTKESNLHVRAIKGTAIDKLDSF
jgi:hypothetical protein